MTKASFHPRLTKAECEFWFEAGADWQEQTERRLETQLADAFPDVSGLTEPFLRFEPNYLAVLSGPMGGVAAHDDIRAHSGCVTRALAAYQDAAHPHRVQTVFLNYQFEFAADVLPCGPKKTVWETPCEMITLERETPPGSPWTRLALRCLITCPPVNCLDRLPAWLDHIHRRMDGAFQDVQQGHAALTGRRRHG